jgi:peptidoglycan/LPS O-acetylase OafA/YrhL
VTKKLQPENQAFLDGIRGGAALFVLVGHCAILGGGIKLPDPKIAVDVFMVLSGYLMMYLANVRAEIEPPGTFTFAIRFWVRRFFRIAPVYYIILAAAILLFNQHESGFRILQLQDPARWVNSFYDLNGPNAHGAHLFTLANLLAHISFAFGLLPKYCSSTLLPDWSIGLEMQFYAFFPLVMILGRRFGLFKTMAGLWVCEVLAKHLINQYCGSLSSFYPEPSFLLIKIQFFLIGMLIANAVFHIRTNPILAGTYLVFGMVACATTSLTIVLIASLMFILATGIHTQAHPLLALHTLVNGFLGNGVTKFMADVSYGVYLVHILFISIFGGWLYSQPFTTAWSPVHRFVWLLSVTLIGSYSVSFLLHICVERPGIKLGRIVLSRLKPDSSHNLAKFHS